MFYDKRSMFYPKWLIDSPIVARPSLSLAWVFSGLITLSPLLCGSAEANNNRAAPAPARAAPAVRPAMAMPGGGARMPGNMGGAPHMPGNMAGAQAAHIPGNMAAAHVPGNMASPAAHVPGNMASPAARVPGNMASPAGHVPGNMAAHVPGGVTNAGIARPGAGAEASRRVGRETPGELRASRPNGEEAGRFPAREGGVGREAMRGPAEMRHEEASRAFGFEHRTPMGEMRHPAMAVMQAHGRMILVGAGAAGAAALAHHEMRPYLQPGLGHDIPRDLAEVDRDRAFVHAHDGDFHTRAVRDLTRPELEAWRRGVWRSEWHYGRRGWWWETDGVWYPYDNPVYPYPLVVAPLQVYETTTVVGPPPVVASVGVAGVGGVAVAGTEVAPGEPASAAVAVIPPLPAPPPGWYRCSEPSGYYPTIGSCPASWALVEEAPPPGTR